MEGGVEMLIKIIEEIVREEKTTSFPIPKLISLVINDDCNFRCKHCDWSKKDKGDDYLTAVQWEKIITDFSGVVDDSVLVIGSREPLFDENSRRKVATVIKAGREAGILSGFITNGTFVSEFWKEHPEVIPDFMDISMEGPKEINDKIRGEGAFQKAFRGLKVARKKVERLFVSITATRANVEIIPDFLIHLIDQGVQNFVIHSLVPGANVDMSLKIDDLDFLLLLSKLEIISHSCQGQIIVDIYPDSFNNFPGIIQILDLKDVFEDSYLVSEISKGLFVRFVNLLESLLMSVLLSAEGSVITPLEAREAYRLKKINKDTDIKDWGSVNPNLTEIKTLIKNISPTCFNQKCFPFCLGQNRFCPVLSGSK